VRRADGRKREVVASRSIGERDELKIWDWFRGEVERYQREVGATPADKLSVKWTAEHNLIRTQKRIDVDGKTHFLEMLLMTNLKVDPVTTTSRS